MFGNLLSSVVKITTLPLDAVNSGIDLVGGGDGSSESRTDSVNPLSIIEQVRDQLMEELEDLDD